MKKARLVDQSWFLQMIFVVLVLAFGFSGVCLIGRLLGLNPGVDISPYVEVIIFLISILGFYLINRKKDIRILLNS